MNVFITSDHHFFHRKIISFFDRPFRNIQEMNEVLIQKWNNKVKDGDLVFHLGDFAVCWNYKTIKEIKDRLNGNIILILGNHDNKTRILKGGISVADSYVVTINKLLLTHRPLRHIHTNGYVNVHGHIHNRRTKGKRINVCVEKTNYEPVELEKILEKANYLLDRQ